MIRFQRYAVASGPNPLKAIQWAKEVTEFINGKWPERKLEVFTGQFGAYGAIYWSVDFEDLVSLESWTNQILADQGYWEMLSKAEGLFQEGHGRDIVMRSA